MRVIALKSISFVATVGKILLTTVRFFFIFAPLILICLGFAIVITVIGVGEVFMKPNPNPLSNRLSVVCHNWIGAMVAWTGVDDFGTSTSK